MTRHHPRMCLLGVWVTTHNIKGFNTPQKTPNGAWLSIFQPKWQNYNIVISPAGNIGSIPNFDVVIEPHSWRRGWSRISKFIFKMADGRHIAEYWKRYNSPSTGPIWMVASYHVPDMSAMLRLPWQRPLPSNGALFSSYGRLEDERVNQFWWNLANNSKLGPQWQSRDQTLKLLKFKMADNRHVWKY